MLLGQYGGKMTPQGRVGFPSKYKETTGNELVIARGYEQSLLIVPRENWKELLSGIENRPLIEAETRDIQRFILSAAYDVELDDKGRFIIPVYLREYAKLGTDIVFLGLEKYIEVWDEQIWKAYQQNLENNIGNIAHRLSIATAWEKQK
jgi:MraZ protein